MSVLLAESQEFNVIYNFSAIFFFFWESFEAHLILRVILTTIFFSSGNSKLDNSIG